MNEPQPAGEFRGYRIFFQGISYSCPTLKLYGLDTERKLRNAIDRKLRNSLVPRDI